MNGQLNQMTRRGFLGMAGLAGLSLVACGNNAASTSSNASSSAAESAAEGISGKYAIHIQGYDWGCGVDKATVTLDSALSSASAADFAVSEYKQTTDFTDQSFPVIEAEIPRTVTNATLSEDGKTLELELACSPSDGDSPLLFSMTTQLNTWSDPYYLNIATAEGSSLGKLAIDKDCVEKSTSADAWTTDSFTGVDGTVLRYAAFTPKEESKTLVVWLHGLGEGGTEKTDPYVTILANKVVALSEDAFQQAVGGAHVVAPQCPTYWMDADGKGTNFSGGAIKADGTSYYLAVAEEFIDSYAKKVGAEKIVIAGCSNGGYMTMLLAASRPTYYSCAVPICEAVPDELVSDMMISSLQNIPLYFVYSKDDTTVDPTLHEIPTIERLKAAGKTADTLYVSTSDHVVDTSGKYTDEAGNPYQYMGHWSWIYFFNNECKAEDGTKAWDFIANNIK
ncbi:MAG: prolyl oligopeptidase family serine peptidase [Coriobacteriales bacterium]|nr:prolyl oligopeptidase family serine peptidase [Coriobacteriales bacterium]